LDALTKQEVQLFDELNASYKSKFEFPFIICVRENKKEAIINGMKARINNNKTQEIDEALKQIFKIAWLRLSDYVNAAKL
jgi:2-oxo-4-hydroxy-4-carboxy-5-ureidoimidazoline decarboxylase